MAADGSPRLSCGQRSLSSQAPIRWLPRVCTNKRIVFVLSLIRSISQCLVKARSGLNKMTIADFVPTPQTTLKRLPQRGSYEREAVYAILDEAFICHVGFVVDGQPFVIPTSFARIGDELYLHGSAAS